jgi:hypothetical protein
MSVQDKSEIMKQRQASLEADSQRLLDSQREVDVKRAEMNKAQREKSTMQQQVEERTKEVKRCALYHAFWRALGC